MSSSRYCEVGNSSAAGRGRSDGSYLQKSELNTPSPGRFDSGFSDSSFFSMPMQVEPDSAIYNSNISTSTGPPRPSLRGGGSASGTVVDAENGDSGINMGEDDTERDCIGTAFHRIQTQIPPSNITPMEVDGKKVIASRSSTRSPPAGAVKKPRVPRRTVAFPTSGSGSSSGGSVRTVSAPHRANSPRSVFTDSHSTPHTYTAPFTNKENHGPYSLPVARSSSPLTCNNFQSLNVVERVPPIAPIVPLDISQLQDYMNLFLPDDKDGDTGFHLAVIHNQPDMLDRLLFIMSKERSLKPVIDEQNTLFQTALHLATHLQQTDTMRKLLIAGASVNITDHKGNTPLHIAAKFSSTRPLEEIVRYISVQTILEVAQVRNNEGLSCVHIAAKNGNMEILRKLRSLGVDMDMQDFNSGKTALHLAVESNSLSNVQFLLETCEANVNSVTYSGCSPLHTAAGRGDISIVAYLVSMGADPELCTDEGDIALDLSGSEEVTAFLTKAAALQWVY